MPAYGAQIIPNVPQVGDPKVPVADHSVMDMIARTGTAGLAAFTNMAAMAQRGELEREQLAQRGALAHEELAYRREDSARDYSLAREQMTHQRSLADAARTFTSNRDTAIMGQATEFTNALADLPYQPGTPEFYKGALKLVAKYPLAGKNQMAAQAWKEAADIHDNSAMSVESARAAAEAAGINLDEADVSYTMTPKGPRLTIKEGRPEKPPTQKTDPAQMENLKAANRKIAGHEKAAFIEKQKNEELGRKGWLPGVFGANTEDKPYSGTKAWEAANAEKQAAEQALSGKKQQAVIPHTDTLTLPNGTKIAKGDTYKGKKWNGGDPMLPSSWE